MIEDEGRFRRILLLTILLHLVLLSGYHFLPAPTHSFQRKMTAMLEVVSSKNANERTPKVAINIGSKAHTSVELRQEKEVLTANKEEISFEKEFKKGLNEQPSLKPNKEAKTPPRRKVISAASYASKDAEYLSNWQMYVEKFGNDHYPKAILNSHLQGNLRLLVAINRDGSLRDVTIRQSSGSPILDEAAIHIVLSAAPFAPFPPELADEIDVLEIIRTWQFRGKLSTSSQ